MWRNVFQIVEAGASATSLSKVILNPSCVRTVAGEKHFVFAKGLPSCASNTFMLAHQYGLVEIFEDEVAKMFVGEDGIPTIQTKRFFYSFFSFLFSKLFLFLPQEFFDTFLFVIFFF